VPYIPSVIVLREKVTLSCDVLCTTYRIRAKHFVCTNCVKYTTVHRPQTTNHTSTFNSRIRLTLTDHNLTIITQITICLNELQLKSSWLSVMVTLIVQRHACRLLETWRDYSAVCATQLFNRFVRYFFAFTVGGSNIQRSFSLR
jgi:hypothetical protein